MMSLSSTIPREKERDIPPSILGEKRLVSVFRAALQVSLGGHGGKYIDGRGLGLAGQMSEMTAEQRIDR